MSYRFSFRIAVFGSSATYTLKSPSVRDVAESDFTLLVGEWDPKDLECNRRLRFP